MPYKTIFVHLNDARSARALLEPAVELATRHGAHLIGMCVYASMPAAPVAAPQRSKVVAAIAAVDHKETEAIAAIFADVTANQPFVAEWRTLALPHVDLAGVVLEHARCADLIVASQADPGWDLSRLMDFPECLALESGRPVLVVPRKGRYREIGRQVMVAWNAGRESARAAFDALPVLTRADRVQIFELKKDLDDGQSLAPGATIAASLARHGVKVTALTTLLADASVGEQILACVADAGADLLVMGAYGHSRMRERVFGGATLHVVRHMTVPTLFCH